MQGMHPAMFISLICIHRLTATMTIMTMDTMMMDTMMSTMTIM